MHLSPAVKRLDLRSVGPIVLPERRMSDTMNIPTSYPSAAPLPLTEQEKVGFIVISLAVVVVCLGCYFCYSLWQHRREREEINYVNTRVDSVLGDMALVPTDFYDEDREKNENEMI
jgi:hypothetical protein